MSALSSDKTKQSVEKMVKTRLLDRQVPRVCVREREREREMVKMRMLKPRLLRSDRDRD